MISGSARYAVLMNIGFINSPARVIGTALVLYLLLATRTYATFSIAAIDPETGEAAVVVTTRVPFVGRAVPWVRAGIGAVATQSWTVVEYGRNGLDLLEKKVAPADAIEQLLKDDTGREKRQLGIIDMQGRTASFTGKENGVFAGSRQGKNYTVQGNILVGPEVLDAVAAHLDASSGTGMPLAERLILALEAGQAKGGDKRWGNFQSAAIRVADPNNPGRGNDHISLAIDVGEHENPIAELKRIYYRTQRRLGYRSFSEVKGNDVVELKRMLHALGYWRKELEQFPATPDEKLPLYDDEAMAAVDAFRKDHGLQYDGNARGLVDDRFVAVLREKYYARKR
jgi:uncharacterized Ntn-hydrolase superfamily protein